MGGNNCLLCDGIQIAAVKKAGGSTRGFMTPYASAVVKLSQDRLKSNDFPELNGREDYVEVEEVVLFFGDPNIKQQWSARLLSDMDSPNTLLVLTAPAKGAEFGYPPPPHM
jgi:arginine/ornithine N-succinyltransferase beta subunit